MRELTFEEQRVKVVMENLFVPALHAVLRESNPVMYDQWQGNACRQTAVLGSVYLKYALPNYTWTAWDGEFKDVVLGKEVRYNHAWIFGRNRQDNKRILADLSRQHHERLFIPVDSNKYPKDHPEYLHMQELERTLIDVPEHMQEVEFYSQLPSSKLYEKVINKMNEMR